MSERIDAIRARLEAMRAYPEPWGHVGYSGGEAWIEAEDGSTVDLDLLLDTPADIAHLLGEAERLQAEAAKDAETIYMLRRQLTETEGKLRKIVMPWSGVE
jgi:hypothetical protein